MDPSALISPVTDALGTLGSGLFEAMDPTAMLEAISQVFQATGGSLQQSMGAVDESWQGQSGTAATTKTGDAINDGAEVAAQSETLKSSLATASTNVAQARGRLIEIIAEFQATLAAIGPSIIFPWGWAAAIAAANKAIAMTAEVITELQSTLGAEAARVTAAGAPVDVASAPTLGSSMLQSLASPLMSMATKAAQSGVQAGTGAASAASQAAGQVSSTPPPTPVADDALAAGAAGPMGGGAGVGGGGGGAGATMASRSFATSPMVQPETASTSTQTATGRAVGATGAGMGMMGAPYGPMAGGHGAQTSTNSHTAADFLHTTHQGDEIVGDLGTAAPPVLGEADPNEPPDVRLRI
ncbi:hypothetical protein ACRCUN_32115 [Mycobacterium sp. LTG2003]